MATLESGEPITPMAVMRNRRDIAFAAGQLRRGVERLAEVSGARIVYDSDPLQAIGDDPHRTVIESGERFVQQHQTRTVQQGALECKALPHPAGVSRNIVVGPLGQAGGVERRAS